MIEDVNVKISTVDFPCGRLARIVLLLTTVFSTSQTMVSQQPGPATKVMVASGWHPWYEIKGDPEEANNLIVCGSKWNVNQNSLFGFVYVSSDGGKTWNKALEDKNSAWVSEQSCAFGPKHVAYFVSEASKVVDGELRHHQGTTRLFVSSDAGQHWTERTKTAWADWSTSAVSASTGNLLTFFNYNGTANQSKSWGWSVGLLAFSADGKRVSGPFVNPAMKRLGYHGVYPSDAVALKDGTVVALYLGFRETPSGQVADLGLERVPPSSPHLPILSVIESSNPSNGGCLGLADYSLAYNKDQNRLFVVYRDMVRKECHLMLATSEDGGSTWAKRVPVTAPERTNLTMTQVSIASRADGTLGLLWDDAGNWFFSTVKDSGIVEPPADVHAERAPSGVISDSLWTVIYQPSGYQAEGFGPVATLGVNVRTLPGCIWRASGLIASGHLFRAIFPALEGATDNLNFATLSSLTTGLGGQNPPAQPHTSELDVTNQVALLYGRAQSFDNATGTLSLEVRLANHAVKPIRTPIHLEAKSVGSAVGKVAILNADNGLSGPGAVWDISRIVVGDQIPAGAVTSSTFTLLFRIDLEHPGFVTSDELLNLTARVLAPGDP
jgi:hypothetical protein